jgi:hypothetical protein
MKYAPLASGYNGLVGGSSPLGPTTQSRATGEFLAACEIRRIGGVVRERTRPRIAVRSSRAGA